MKARRKPIEDEVWQNVGPDDTENHEPMPDWVRGASEPNAEAGLTFLVKTVHGPALCQVKDFVIKGPTDIYPCSPEGFMASYEPFPETESDVSTNRVISQPIKG